MYERAWAGERSYEREMAVERVPGRERISKIDKLMEKERHGDLNRRTGSYRGPAKIESLAARTLPCQCVAALRGCCMTNNSVLYYVTVYDFNAPVTSFFNLFLDSRQIIVSSPSLPL